MVKGTSSLLGPLFGTDEMTAVFDDGSRLQGILDFEAALVGEAGQFIARVLARRRTNEGTG